MKRLIIGLTLCCAAIVAFGAAEEPTQEELTQQIKELLKSAPSGAHGGKIITPEIKVLMDKRSGGLVTPKTNGKTFLLVDARGVQDGFLDTFVKALKERFHLGVSPQTKALDAKADAFEVAKSMKTQQSPAIVMIVSREGKPVLSVYPEDAVGIVNAAPLKSADAKVYRTRIEKEVWRGLLLAFGGGVQAMPNGRVGESILSPVHKLADLDRIKAIGPSPSQQSGIYDAVSGLGLQAAKPVIYSMACRQGWAPAPTNAIQRAIWEKIHAVPKNPMKIEFDPKKGR